MIEVKLTFGSQAELLAFFTGAKPAASADERVAANIADKRVTVGKPAPTPTAPAAEGASTATATASPSDPKPAAASAPPAAHAASTASPSAPDASAPVDYEVLKKATLTLAQRDRPKAVEVTAAFNVKTFRELDPSRWGEALAAVNAALAA